MRIFWDVTSVTRRPDTVPPLDLVREDTVTASPTRWSKTPATPITRASSGCRPSIVNVPASAPSSWDFSVPVKKNTKMLNADIRLYKVRKCRTWWWWVRKNQDSKSQTHEHLLLPCLQETLYPVAAVTPVQAIRILRPFTFVTLRSVTLPRTCSESKKINGFLCQSQSPCMDRRLTKTLKLEFHQKDG